jgi:hypothetical protein
VRTRRRRVTGTAEIVAAVRSAKQFLTHAASGPFQYAGAKALRLPDAYFTAFREDLRTKRDLLGAGLADVGSRVFRPAGTYLITTNILGQREQKRPGAAILLRQGKEQPGRGGQVFLGALCVYGRGQHHWPVLVRHVGLACSVAVAVGPSSTSVLGSDFGRGRAQPLGQCLVPSPQVSPCRFQDGSGGGLIAAPQIVGGLLQEWQHRVPLLVQELGKSLVCHAKRTPQMVHKPPQLEFPTVSLGDLPTADQRDRRGLGAARNLGCRGFAQNRERSGFIELCQHRCGGQTAESRIRLQPGAGVDELDCGCSLAPVADPSGDLGVGGVLVVVEQGIEQRRGVCVGQFADQRSVDA